MSLEAIVEGSVVTGSQGRSLLRCRWLSVISLASPLSQPLFCPSSFSFYQEGTETTLPPKESLFFFSCLTP